MSTRQSCLHHAWVKSVHSSSGRPETVSVWSVLSKRLGTAVGGPPFSAKTALTRKGMDSTTPLNVCSKMLAASFKPCKLWGGASMDGTCLSSTSHRCSIGLRSEESGGQINTLNSSLCSSNHSWTIFAVWPLSAEDRGQHWQSDRSAVSHPHTQQAAMHCVFWHLSIRTSINFFCNLCNSCFSMGSNNTG